MDAITVFTWNLQKFNVSRSGLFGDSVADHVCAALADEIKNKTPFIGTFLEISSPNDKGVQDILDNILIFIRYICGIEEIEGGYIATGGSSNTREYIIYIYYGLKIGDIYNKKIIPYKLNVRIFLSTLLSGAKLSALSTEFRRIIERPATVNRVNAAKVSRKGVDLDKSEFQQTKKLKGEKLVSLTEAEAARRSEILAKFEHENLHYFKHIDSSDPFKMAYGYFDVYRTHEDTLNASYNKQFGGETQKSDAVSKIPFAYDFLKSRDFIDQLEQSFGGERTGVYVRHDFDQAIGRNSKIEKLDSEWYRDGIVIPVVTLGEQPRSMRIASAHLPGPRFSKVKEIVDAYVDAAVASNADIFIGDMNSYGEVEHASFEDVNNSIKRTTVSATGTLRGALDKVLRLKQTPWQVDKSAIALEPPHKIAVSGEVVDGRGSEDGFVSDHYLLKASFVFCETKEKQRAAKALLDLLQNNPIGALSFDAI